MAKVEKLKQIEVQATGDDMKVVLWERHTDHPLEGEAFIYADGGVHTVAETKAVKALIAEGRLTTTVNWNSTPAEVPAKNKGGRPRKNGEATEVEKNEAGLKAGTEEPKPFNPFGAGIKRT